MNDGGVAFFKQQGQGRDGNDVRLTVTETVEDAIADIATVFHWQPTAFDEMYLDELMSWREKAIERSQSE
ncbi:GpE family phage tail protein [Gallibacterium anatis]|uniref:GpE family phage tail protein n=1 Tax=Gallibacterium anatis TaxID=750 RepID=UPI0018AFFB07